MSELYSCIRHRCYLYSIGDVALFITAVVIVVRGCFASSNSNVSPVFSVYIGCKQIDTNSHLLRYISVQGFTVATI